MLLLCLVLAILVVPLQPTEAEIDSHSKIWGRLHLLGGAVVEGNESAVEVSGSAFCCFPLSWLARWCRFCRARLVMLARRCFERSTLRHVRPC